MFASLVAFLANLKNLVKMPLAVLGGVKGVLAWMYSVSSSPIGKISADDVVKVFASGLLYFGVFVGFLGYVLDDFGAAAIWLGTGLTTAAHAVQKWASGPAPTV